MAKKQIILSVDEVTKNISDIKTKYEELKSAQKEFNKLKKNINFYSNGNPDSFWSVERCIDKNYSKQSSEYNEALKKCFKNNKDLAFSYFQSSIRVSDDIRQCAFDIIMQYPDDVFNKLVGLRYGNMPFTKDELDIYYDKHAIYHYKQVESTLNGLYKYCMLFKKFITEEQKQLLIRRILGRKHTYLANELLDDKAFKLTKEMKEQLESLKLFQKMSGWYDD